MPLELMYITNNLDLALVAEKAGVNRIWIDLETLGKEERQKGMNTVKSHHTIDDIKKISPHLKKAKLLVRINPWNENSKREIEQVIAAGAEIIMLPMWKSIKEVKLFIETVAKRTKTILLLETKEAENCLDEVLKIDDVDEIHIGLNDLHISYGLYFMFELLTNGTVERICKKIKLSGKKFGFGGISHIGDGLIPAEMIVVEHYRLGSSMVILSRGFCDLQSPTRDLDFVKNVKDLRKLENNIVNMSVDEINNNTENIKKRVKFILEKKNEA